MNLRLPLLAAAVAVSAVVVSPAPSMAGGMRHHMDHIRAHMPDMSRLCPLSWWRHRDRAVAPRAEAKPKAVAAKKVAAKKVAAKKAAPLK
jgi:hypothetical protein